MAPIPVNRAMCVTLFHQKRHSLERNAKEVSAFLTRLQGLPSQEWFVFSGTRPVIERCQPLRAAGVPFSTLGSQRSENA